MIQFRQFWAARYARVQYWFLDHVLSPFKFTSGFGSFEDFNDHYTRHGAEHPSFGKGVYSYARFADRFCGGPKPPTILEHVMRDGTVVRVDPNTRIVGILHTGGIIGTCHVRSNWMNWFRKQQLK